MRTPILLTAALLAGCAHSRPIVFPGPPRAATPVACGPAALRPTLVERIHAALPWGAPPIPPAPRPVASHATARSGGLPDPAEDVLARRDPDERLVTGTRPRPRP